MFFSGVSFYSFIKPVQYNRKYPVELVINFSIEPVFMVSVESFLVTSGHLPRHYHKLDHHIRCTCILHLTSPFSTTQNFCKRKILRKFRHQRDENLTFTHRSINCNEKWLDRKVLASERKLHRTGSQDWFTGLVHRTGSQDWFTEVCCTSRFCGYTHIPKRTYNCLENTINRYLLNRSYDGDKIHFVSCYDPLHTLNCVMAM